MGFSHISITSFPVVAPYATFSAKLDFFNHINCLFKPFFKSL